MGRKKLVRAIKSFGTKLLRTGFSSYLGHMSRIEDSSEAVQKIGFKFSGNELMERGLFEPIETRLVSSIFPRVDTVINVGANIGYYVCQALHHNRNVIAFEPMANNLKKLMDNITSNNWQHRCEIYPVALGNKTDIIKIYGDDTGASLIKGWASTPEDHFTLTPCLTLNNVLGTRLDGKKILIIVDVEGSEDMMLEGASVLLGMNPKPIWLVEICVEEHQPGGAGMNPFLRETFNKFWSNGYKCISADSKLRAIEEDEVDNIYRTGKNTFGTYNFIFYDKNLSNFI